MLQEAERFIHIYHFYGLWEESVPHSGCLCFNGAISLARSHKVKQSIAPFLLQELRGNFTELLWGLNESLFWGRYSARLEKLLGGV